MSLIAEVGSTFISVVPSTKGFGRTLDGQIGGEAKSSGGRFGKAFGTAFKVGAVAVAGAALVAGKFLKDSIGEAREAQKVGAQTNAVIKSTGGVANVTAKSIGKLSTAISKKAGIDDEAIQAGGNLLLTFTNIRNEAGKGNKVFDQTVQAATDMSVALGTDMKSSALQLGKALNDPVKGMTKLQRSGVTFTDQQKKQVAAMVKTGDTLGAQKLILAEVNKEFGGSAAAQATAGDKFKVAFGNLEESIGTALLPLLDKGLTAGTKFATFLTHNIGPGIASLNGFLAPAIKTVQSFFSSLSGGGSGASSAVATFKSLGTSIATNFLPVLKAMATTFTTVILPTLQRFGAYLVANLFPIFKQIGTILVTNVLPILASLARFFYGTLVPAVYKIVNAIGTALKPVFDQLFETIQTSVLPTVQRLLVKFREWQPTIEKVVTVVVKIIGKILVLAATILGKVLPPLIRFAAFMLKNAVGAIIAVITVLAKVIGKLIDFGYWVKDGITKIGNFATKINNKIGEAIGYIKDLPTKAKDALGDLKTALVQKGKDLIQGLIDGIGAKFKALKDKVGEITGWIGDHFPGSPIKRGPLVSWNNGGAGKRLIDEGLIAGLDSRGSALSSSMNRLTNRINIPRVGIDPTAGSPAALAGAGNTFQVYETQNPSATARQIERHLAFAGGS